MEPRRCKLEVDGKVIQQVFIFKYLRTELSRNGDIEEEVYQQILKATRIAGCLSDTIWRNKHLRRETIRPVMTYTAETRPDASKMRGLL